MKDYGDLLAITADGSGMAHLGFGTMAAASAPLLPSGGGEVLPTTESTGTTGDDGGVAGDTGSSGDGGGGDTAGDSGGSGGGSGGGGGGDGGAAGKLAFTGFGAAMVGALGAGLTGAGSALRKYLARR